MNIVRPVTDDGLVGYDQYGQLVCQTKKGDHTVSEFITDVRDKKCSVCGRGWKLTGPGMKNQFEWRAIGEIVHESCYVRFESVREQAHFLNVLHSNRVQYRNFKKIENQYWPRTYRISKKPWYTAEMKNYPVLIELGSRKHVHSISLIAQGQSFFRDEHRERLESLFENQSVTKEFSSRTCLVHSYTEDNDRLYLSMLLDGLRLINKPEEQP